MKEVQKEDPDTNPVLEFKESISVRSCWPDISTSNSIAKLIELCRTHSMFEIECCIESENPWMNTT